MGQKGTIFLTTMICLFLMTLMGGYAFQMAGQDLHFIGMLKKSAQAQYLAEAGIAEAASILTADFDAKDNALNFPETALGEGTYDVTVVQSGERVLLSSEGSVDGVTRTAMLEIKDNSPTALNYAQAGGNNVLLFTIIGSDADITGDIFANINAILTAGLWTSITIDGDVFAGGQVIVTEFVGGNVSLNSATDNAGNITFPSYDFQYYRAIAQANGRYYNGNTVFNNQTINLNTAGGVLFVDGNVTFKGTCNVTGAIISTGKIMIYGRLNHARGANYPTFPALMTEDDDILLLKLLVTRGRLFANGLVYSGKDITLVGVNTQLNVTGSVIAKGNIIQANGVVSDLDIVYNPENPPGLIVPAGGYISIKSYNS